MNSIIISYKFHPCFWYKIYYLNVMKKSNLHNYLWNIKIILRNYNQYFWILYVRRDLTIRQSQGCFHIQQYNHNIYTLNIHPRLREWMFSWRGCLLYPYITFTDRHYQHIKQNWFHRLIQSRLRVTPFLPEFNRRAVFSWARFTRNRYFDPL